MTRTMRSGTTHMYAAVAAMLCLGMATGAGAAIEASEAGKPATSAAQKPIEELEQLDEIRVRGKSLAFAISDAEDDFFKLYNKLNKDGKYDISCGYTSLSGSLIRTRACVPTFLTARPSFGGSGCGGSAEYFVINDLYGTAPRYQGGGCFHGPAFTGPSAEALIMHWGPAYVDHVIKVINNDQRLKEKVRNIDALYAELQRVQGRYDEVHGVRVVKARYVAPPRKQPTARPR
jgi:hypothetical protein